MTTDTFGLPKDLGDGLRLRWATAADIEPLAEFNTKMHADNAEEVPLLRYWFYDLAQGKHPTTNISDFTLVEDTKTGEIVSTLCTIHQTWGYEGIPFLLGRVELVGTLEAYRRRGLVRQQMEAVHAKGAARGELMQGITGIPWYYRKFDYEMALDLGGGRYYNWDKPGNLVRLTEDKEPYTWRTAKESDIPFLEQLYRLHCSASMIYTIRPKSHWQHELAGHHEQSLQLRHRWIVVHKELGDVAYVQFSITEPHIVVYEVAAVPGHSLRAVALYLTRMFKGLAKLRAEKEKDKPKIANLIFRLGAEHPVYQALGRQLERPLRPYAWYIRIPDIPAFLRKIQPVLERRLAVSVMAGHTGNLRINLYARGTLNIEFDNGHITSIGTYQKKEVADGDVHYPDLLFVQQLCGRHTLAELNEIYADCYGSPEAEILTNILFPKRSSLPIGLG